jgi:hypothetical protein
VIRLDSLPRPITDLSGWLTLTPFVERRVVAGVVVSCRACRRSKWGLCQAHGGPNDTEKMRLRRAARRIGQ